RHTRSKRDWSSDVCSSDLAALPQLLYRVVLRVLGEAAEHGRGHLDQAHRDTPCEGIGVSGGHRRIDVLGECAGYLDPGRSPAHDDDVDIALAPGERVRPVEVGEHPRTEPDRV